MMGCGSVSEAVGLFFQITIRPRANQDLTELEVDMV